MDAAEPRLQHSSVVAAAKSDAAPDAARKSVTEYNKIRTSDGMFFARGESPLVAGAGQGSNALRPSMLAAAERATLSLTVSLTVCEAMPGQAAVVTVGWAGDIGSNSCRA